MEKRIQRALVSVSDKRGLESFARMLSQMGVEVVATGGTYRLLREAGVEAREVADVTGFPEMMDGRVKTLHPRIHGGILALRNEPTHVAAMEEQGIGPIDLVAVNLYPFEATVAREGVAREEAVEQIDIGGPSMLRSAAKNHDYVTVVTDPDDYGRVLDEMERFDGAVSHETRRELARKAFALTARYDAAIARWLHAQDAEDELPASHTLTGIKVEDLRYGENPHQVAALYRATDPEHPSVVASDFLGGKALSYNNLVDLDSALALAAEFSEPFVCVLKHNNPCGAASADAVADALRDAWAGDPLSAFGSVLGFNRPVDLDSARFLTSENRFVEAIVAPSFEDDALELLRTGAKWGKNVRLLACGPLEEGARRAALDVKPLRGGFLVQGRDVAGEAPPELEVATKAQPTDAQVASLRFAELVCKHVKSNAIVIAKERRVLGVGAGQMSRVDSVHLAVQKSGDEVGGAVLASDAFFPFPDGVEAAMEAGVTAILQPGGSIRDAKVVEVCDARGVPMVLTGVRHFRH